MINEIQINPNKLQFNLKTREMCKSCKRYGFKATCPPHLESIKYYENILKQYKYGKIYYKVTEIKDVSSWEYIGKQTSLEIHNKLIDIRNKLFNNGHYFINIFGSGSCKLCTSCSFPCRYPQKSVIPLEATGIDVVKLMKQYKIDITFPITNIIYRVGMVLYD